MTYNNLCSLLKELENVEENSVSNINEGLVEDSVDGAGNKVVDI